MAIQLSTGEIVDPLDVVTTIKEITETFPISRGSVVMWMYQDKFEWRQVAGTFIISSESFVDFWNDKYRNSLDVSETSR